MSLDDLIIDDDGDDSIALGDAPVNVTPILLVAEKPEFIELGLRTASVNPSLSMEQAPHTGIIEGLRATNASAVLIEVRVVEAFEDLGLLRDIRRERPLIPIIVISDNADPDFMLEGYKAGATDYIGSLITPEVLGQKIFSLNKLSESARLIEVQNNQLVSTMKAQREADEKRMMAEKDKSIAEAQAEANRQTKEILDNLKEGFFVVEKSLVIGKTTSKSCETIFGHAIAGRSFEEALPLVGDGPRFIKASLEQLFDNFMPMDVSLSLLPSRWQTISGKVVEVVYTPMLDDKGDPQRVIIAASDVTKAIEEKRKLERANATNRALIQIINDRASFLEFFGDFKRDVGILASTDDVAVGKRILHTLKGNSSAYDLVELAEYIHHIEDDVEKIQSEVEMVSKMKSVAVPIFAELNAFIAKYSEVLQLQTEGDSDETFTISGENLGVLETLALTLPSEVGAVLAAMCDRLRKVPVMRMTKAFKQTVERIATRQRKEIAYRAVGTDTELDSRKYGSLFRNLIHAVRNSCDHGIETSEERLDKGKSDIALISLKVSTAGSNLEVSVLDDGRGLNRERIIGKALEKGLITEEQGRSMPKDEWVKLIFMPGFSTAENVSSVSGRGIGMDCIRTEVNRLGGTLEVKTKANIGTQVILRIPLEQPAQIEMLEELPLAS